MARVVAVVVLRVALAAHPATNASAHSGSPSLRAVVQARVWARPLAALAETQPLARVVLAPTAEPPPQLKPEGLGAVVAVVQVAVVAALEVRRVAQAAMAVRALQAPTVPSSCYWTSLDSLTVHTSVGVGSKCKIVPLQSTV